MGGAKYRYSVTPTNMAAVTPQTILCRGEIDSAPVLCDGKNDAGKRLWPIMILSKWNAQPRIGLVLAQATS
jgi:hypothetical protein